MRTAIPLLSAALLLGACGTLQETAQVRDDVYDIPDRTVVASVDPLPETSAPSGSDDYYNEEEAASTQQGNYWDRTYNDPQWYNRDRFGFGYNASPWGSSWNLSYGSGWGNNTWYNSPTGMYNPYWGNSWQSGYGYYSPWNSGMYDPWGWGGYGCGFNCGFNSPYGWGNSWGYGGYGYGGYGGYGGYNPYYGYGSGAWGGNEGWDGNGQSVIVRPRPSMGGGGNPGGANVTTVPRALRPQNDFSLLRPPVLQKQKVRTDRPGSPARFNTGRPAPAPREQNTTQPQRKERKERVVRPERTRERNFEPTPRNDRGGGGGNSGGGNRGGGGSTPSPSPSPRPRR